jgi:hypothetical protein
MMKENCGFALAAEVVKFLGLAVAVCASCAAFDADAEQPCAKNPEIRQLDYWLGNWKAVNGAGKNMSRVSLSMDKCVFVEQWENGKGHITEKMFVYSLEEKNWYGMFIDNEGRVHVFLDGKVSSDVAEFHGPSRGPNGEAVLNRLKVIRVSADKLEESWEKSTDNGSTWTTAYRAEYARVESLIQFFECPSERLSELAACPYRSLDLGKKDEVQEPTGWTMGW